MLILNASLDDLARYLTKGFWDDQNSARPIWNLENSGYNPKNGTITYSVRSNWADENGISETHSQFVERSFDYLSSIIGINFIENLDGYGADIVFSDNDTGAYTQFVDGSLDPYLGLYYLDQVSINVEPDWYSQNPDGNDYVFQTFLHEIGHA